MDVGAQLRQAREARGLSVAAVAATTRIQARVLDALERNDLSAVPPRPYARGFVAAYAREVGLDQTEIVRDFFAQFDEAPPAPRTIAPPAEANPATRHWQSWLPALAILVLFVAVSVMLGWRTRLLRAPEPDAVGTTGVVIASADRTAPAAAVQRAADAAPAVPARHDIARASTTADLVVTLDPQGPSWVSATVDGQRVIYRILQPGSKETLRAVREITIRVGDAGAMKWSVNGRDAVTMGNPGEVRNVTVKQ